MSGEGRPLEVVRPRHWARLAPLEQASIALRAQLGKLIRTKVVEADSIQALIRPPSSRQLAREVRSLQQAVESSLARPDCFEAELAALSKRLAAQSGRNGTRLKRLRKQVASLGTQELLHRAQLVNYYEAVLRDLEYKQLAESISYFEEVFPRGKKSYARLHFEEALEWPVRTVTLAELEQLSNAREHSLLHYFSVGHKTTFSTSSFYEPANSAIVAGTRLSREDSVFRAQGRRGQLKSCYCHQCRLVYERTAIFACGAELRGRSCARYYCPNCIKLFYSDCEMVCFSCAEACNCTRCQREARMEKLRAIKDQLQHPEESDSETH
jgi:hypothetical protein